MFAMLYTIGKSLSAESFGYWLYRSGKLLNLIAVLFRNEVCYDRPLECYQSKK